MTEAPGEQITIKKSPLDQVHKRLGAVMTEQAGWAIPSSYGDEQAEYSAVREGGVGLIDVSSRGRLLVTGSEAVQFLNGLITNDMKTLEESQWMPAVFANVQGRLLASVRVSSIKDKYDSNDGPGFLIDTEPATHEVVLKTLTRFTLAGDFRVRDLTDNTALLSLQGKDAAALLRQLLGSAADLGKFRVTQTRWNDNWVTILRATHTGEDGFDLFVDSEGASELWQELMSAGARPVGFDALEALRIEAGHARYGVDIDETNVVSETNLDEAISFTKGCYIGQEIIVRIKHRGHVAKKLTGVTFDRKVDIQRNTNLLSEVGKEVGRITSVTFSPLLNRTIALAYIKYDYLQRGTKLNADSNEQVTATVIDLPFVRGGWNQM